MVIRVVAVPDYLDLPDFDDVFRTILGWDGLGFLFRVHGQEFTSFRRRTRSKTLRDFQLRPRETFLYTCGAIDLWEWDIRLLDRETGVDGDAAPLCVGGRGASPPEHCAAGTKAGRRWGGAWCGLKPIPRQVQITSSLCDLRPARGRCMAGSCCSNCKFGFNSVFIGLDILAFFLNTA